MSVPPLASATTLARELCACSRKEAKSALLSGWLTPPTTLPPAASIKRVASRCIAWPKAKSAVKKNQLSPPRCTIDLAELAATAYVSQVQCTPTGEHALPVRSTVAALDSRRTRFFSLAISCTPSAIAEL